MKKPPGPYTAPQTPRSFKGHMAFADGSHLIMHGTESVCACEGCHNLIDWRFDFMDYCYTCNQKLKRLHLGRRWRERAQPLPLGERLRSLTAVWGVYLLSQLGRWGAVPHPLIT